MDSDERYTAFVREHTPALLKTAYLLTRNAGEAEELVQDTLVWLYPRWQQVEFAEHQLAYVRKAVVNRYLAGRRRLSATEVFFDPSWDRAPDRPVTRDRTAEVDERIALWAQLGELSERQRAALVLRFFHDLPDDEVAEVLECRVGTVRSLISRGLSVLRGVGDYADDAISSRYLRNVT
ncbi:SigE family RNA polymerase sigma factor [Jatrophihabitans sp.]|uniref:SigE family RNA polymerase sigma factor n=1 Tax=Jatrophihabitans sp. TaxID=1932789 RepID=UPI002C185AED|nr:SigE family RNA polymerase sigma factor [Jatrophihabitans sp.]